MEACTKYISYIFFTLLLINSSIVYAAAAEPALPQVIGQVVWVKNSLKAQQPNAESRTLARRSSIYEHDTITSDPNSSGEVSFTDDSALALQESSTVKIDQYSHKKDDTGADTFVVNVLKGGFRTVTGAISKNNPGGYKATTPVGTIGVMGTVYSVYYNPIKGSLAAKLDKGSIVVSNKEGEVTLTKCASGNKQGAGSTPCINKLYAEVNGANKAPQSVSQKPTVFDSEPALTTTGFPKSGGGGGLVGSFCIN